MKNNTGKLLLVFICFVIFVCAFFIKSSLGKKKYFSEIMQGDFSRVYGLSENEILEMKNFFDKMKKCENIKWVFWDFNSDGMKELLLMENNDNNINKIFAVFRKEGRTYYRILWDVSDSDEYYFLGRENLVYCSEYQGIFQYKSYSECCFNEKWEITVLKKMEIFGVTDLEEWNEIPDNFLALDRPEIEKKGISYYMTLNCQGTLGKMNLTEKEWTETIERIIGTSFDMIEPEWYDATRLLGESA